MDYPSIRNLPPFYLSGRHARKGFLYQDHITVGLCLDFIVNPNLKEIWLETHDDILLFWEEEEKSVIEFVQVKATDNPSRWSVPSICGNGNPQDSIVKKQMDQDRCSEDVLFRIVSSYDVINELTILKARINSLERKLNTQKEGDLGNAISEKLNGIISPNGKTISEWVQRCWWEKKVDNISDLENSNKIALKAVLEKLGKIAFSDQRNEIYQRILKYCQIASSCDLTTTPERYKDGIYSEISKLESALESRESEVNFEEISSLVEDQMANYLNERVKTNPDRWPHNKPNFRIWDKAFSLKVNEGKWSKVLGATSKLIFLFSYHYALLALSKYENFNYPGLLIIDFPPELPNTENISISESYVVEPFIELCKSSNVPIQIIVTGKSFTDIKDANVIRMENVWK